MPKSENIPIINLRGKPVLIDADLARLYGVTTKRLNEQVKRNAKRFPKDFRYRLTQAEKSEVVANCDHLNNLKFSKTLLVHDSALRDLYQQLLPLLQPPSSKPKRRIGFHAKQGSLK